MPNNDNKNQNKGQALKPLSMLQNSKKDGNQADGNDEFSIRDSEMSDDWLGLILKRTSIWLVKQN